jgi:nicotinate-nucleotide adenylyltransferase
MKIVLFGGAFNPVHNEHINIARAAVERLKPDKLVVIPTAISPHKKGKLAASNEQRLEMCRLAFKDIPCAEVSDYEIANGGVSYSYITCNHFREMYKDADIYFLVGADMLENFPKWKKPEEIVSKVKLAACARENQDDFEGYKNIVESKFNCIVETIPYVGKKVSSTRIRVLAALGEQICLYEPQDVCQYIKDNGIYFMPNLVKVKELLTEERWQHSVRVAIMCAKYAEYAQLSEEQAITMGALHDCAKYLKKGDKLLEGFTLDEDVPAPVVHQFSGAYVAVNHFGITDESLINAIKYHASGRENMTKTEALLYLCDMLEESRNFDGVEELRDIFKRDLYACLYAALKHQVTYLKSTGKPIYGLTEKAYNYLKEKNNNDK